MARAERATVEELLTHARWIEGLARALVRDPERAEDLAQSTLLVALQGAPAHVERPRSWLASVLRNLLREDHRRAAQRVEVERRGARAERLPSPEELIARAESERRLVEEVLGLEPRHSAILLLHYFEGLPLAEIARLEERAPSSVSERLALAHAALRARLEHRGGTGGLAALAPLLRRPPASAPTSTASPTPTDWILMSTSAKALTGVAVLALVLGFWFVTRGDEPGATGATGRGAVITESPQVPAPSATPAGDASLARTGAAETPRAEEPAASKADPSAATPATQATTVFGRIHGRVWNPKGEPAVGRPVRIFGTPRGPVKTVHTDVEGRFDERELGPGKYHVSTQPEAAELKALGISGQFATLESLAQVSVELEAGEEVELDLGALPKDPIRVHGRLTGFDPSPEALLQWVPEGEDGYNRARYVSTRDGGRFELLLAEAGRYRISALVQPDSIRCDQAVDVPRAEAWEHDIALPRGELLLRVVARGDRPVKNAQVELTPRAGIAPIPFMSATPFARRTDAEGRVRVGTLRAGRWAVAVHDASLSKEEPLAATATSVAVVEGGPAPAELVIVLEAGIVPTGRVVDEAGQRFYFANVVVFDADGEPLNPLFGATTNKQGEYTLTGLRPGRYSIVAAYGDRWSDVVELAVPETAPAEAPELVLRAAAVLEVVFGDAEPAWIDVRDAGGRCLSAVLDRNLFTGGFGRGCSTRSWSGWLPRGNYEVVARARSGAGTSRRVALIAGERTTTDLQR